MRKRKRGYVRTTVSLPKEVWEELRIESIKRKTTMGELIAEKLKELKDLRSRLNMVDP